jgi:hypothetical protein
VRGGRLADGVQLARSAQRRSARRVLVVLVGLGHLHIMAADQPRGASDRIDPARSARSAMV